MTVQTRFRLDTVRVDWHDLFEGKQFKEGEGKFRCGAIVIVPKDHPQFKLVCAAVEEAAAVKWKDKAAAKLKSARWPSPGPKDPICFKDAEHKAKDSDGYEGAFYLSANCEGNDIEAKCMKPKVFGADKTVITDPAENPIYRGCYVNALVELYADDRYSAGVFCKLLGIQFSRDGDAFGSAPVREDDFDNIAAGADADDMV